MAKHAPLLVFICDFTASLLLIPSRAQDLESDDLTDTPPIIFGLSGEATVESIEQVISGTLVLKGEISIDKMPDVRLVALSALSKVCENKSSPVVAEIVQDMQSYGDVEPEFVIDYHMLPPRGGGHYCMESLAMFGYGNAEPPFDEAVGPPPIRELLQMEFRAHAPTYWLSIDDWKVELANHTCAFANTRSPVERAYTEYTTTEPPGGTLEPPGACKDGDPNMPEWIPPDKRPASIPVGSCNYANNPCTCAAFKDCKWVPDGGGGMWCQPGLPWDSISCGHCPLQSKCPSSAASICAQVVLPCACVASTGDCRWDLGTQSCVARQGGETPCAACTAQIFCSAPIVVGMEPMPAGRMLPVMGDGDLGVGWKLNLTFDRPMVLSAHVPNSVQLFCRSTLEQMYTVFEIPQNKLAMMNTSALQVDVGGTANEKTRECDLVIVSGALRDLDYVSFEGLPEGKLTVLLGDTVRPDLSHFNPANSEVGVTINTSLSIHFTEVVFPNKIAVAILTALGGEWEGGGTGADVIVARINLNGPRASVNADDRSLTIDFTGILETTILYSLFIKPGAVVDAAGNEYLGLPTGIYQFRTAADTYSIEMTKSSSIPWKRYAVIAVIGGVGLGCCVASILAVCRMCFAWRKMKQQCVGPPLPLQNWVPEPLSGSDEFRHKGTTVQSIARRSPSPTNARGLSPLSPHSFAHTDRSPASVQTPVVAITPGCIVENQELEDTQSLAWLAPSGRRPGCALGTAIEIYEQLPL